MTKLYEKKARPIAATIKVILLIALIYFQVKICYVEWIGTTEIIRNFNLVLEIAKLIVVIYIINSFQSPAYKLKWIIGIVFVPIPTFILFLLIGNTDIPNSYQKRVKEEEFKTREVLPKDNRIFEELKQLDKVKYNQAKYLERTTGLPLYNSGNIEYYDIGEKYFDAMMQDIPNAKKYIFIDVFNISESTMWNRLYDVLKNKAKDGVKIYLVTDGMINSEKYPKNFKQDLDKVGISYRIFNPPSFNVNSYINYRDHRKVVVIDGEITYTGGINIGDPYINLYPKFGHWKDVGVKITGEPVSSYIAFFISMWNICSDNQKLDYKNYVNDTEKSKETNKGYIMPYCDGPENSSNPAENIYMQIINSAKDYVYITSPYLILDDTLVSAFINSAKSGVDVRIIVPYIPDKPFVHRVGKSFYLALLEAGVRIFEYKPGFIHAKVFVSDDELCTVGTANLDFRGLYMHYECGNWLYKTGIETTVKDDFIKTQEKCIEITLKEWQNRSRGQRLLDKILITFSPLI